MTEHAIWHWVWGKETGRRVIMGPYRSGEEADKDGFMNFQDYEVVPLPTSDRAKASQMLRKRMLDETHNFEETFKRFKHIREE